MSSPLSARSPLRGAAGLVTKELSMRRNTAIKKAFKCLDPAGSGAVSTAALSHALMSAPTSNDSHSREYAAQLSTLASIGPAGQPVVTFEAFFHFYHKVSGSIARDSDFEQLLQSQWGHLAVSDILAAMRKQFTLAGLAHAFQDQVPGDKLSNMSPQQFEAGLRRVGLQLRPDDLHKVFRAFVSSQGSGLSLDDLREELLSARPETPVPMTRDLPMPMLQSGSASDPPVGQPPPSIGNVPDKSMGMAPPGIDAPAVPLSAPGSHLAAVHSVALGQPPPGASSSSAPPVAAPPGAGALVPATAHRAHGQIPAGPISDSDMDAALSHLEAHLNHIKSLKAGAGAASAARPPSHGAGPGPEAAAGLGPPVGQHPAGAAQQQHHHHLVHHEIPEGPVSDADMDSVLNSLEHHLNHVKAHKPIKDQQQTQPPPPPVEMPHWEHHKYGHHKITEPAWKPEDKVNDMYGHQHAASEYHYGVYGAGGHGHHLAHYHLNDYHGLAHHSFKPEEYQRQTYGDAKHHGHWVPHLHGIGTESHHGEHSYKAEEYHKDSFGKPGHHGHWVPHLHGLGQPPPKPP